MLFNGQGEGCINDWGKKHRKASFFRNKTQPLAFQVKYLFAFYCFEMHLPNMLKKGLNTEFKKPVDRLV